MIRRLLELVLFLLAGSSISCAHSPLPQKTRTMKVDTYDLQYFDDGTSMKSRFLFTTTRSADSTPAKIAESRAFALESDGKVVPMKAMKSRTRDLSILDVRPVEKGLYGYVFCSNSPYKCAPSEIRFMELDGTEVELVPAPDDRLDLNFHDVKRLPNGNFLYLFSTFDYGAKTIENRIQEWDSRGQAVFNWNYDDHLNAMGTTDRIAHINSIDVDFAGDIYISVPKMNSVFKIEKKTGRVMEKISKDTWKFPNDPYGGFVFQHTVRVLPNGNLLMFDNGDGVADRPSRAVEYRVDSSTKMATLVWEYRMPEDDARFRQIGGSVQRLSNGNTFISWGTPSLRRGNHFGRIFTEVDPRGRTVRELKGGIFAYRVWLEELIPVP